MYRIVSLALITFALLLSVSVLTQAQTSSHSGVQSKAVAYLNQGRASYEKGKYELAIAALNKAIELNGKYYDAYFFRGLTRFKQEQFEKSIADLEKALKLKPDSLSPYITIGWANLCLYRGNEAFSAATRILNTAPDTDLARFGILIGYLGLREMNSTHAGEYIAGWKKRINQMTFTFQIMEYLSGVLSERDFENSAAAYRQPATARVYIGMNLALAGKRDAALGHLRWVKDNGDKTEVQYIVAMAELNRLEANVAEIQRHPPYHAAAPVQPYHAAAPIQAPAAAQPNRESYTIPAHTTHTFKRTLSPGKYFIGVIRSTDQAELTTYVVDETGQKTMMLITYWFWPAEIYFASLGVTQTTTYAIVVENNSDKPVEYDLEVERD